MKALIHLFAVLCMALALCSCNTYHFLTVASEVVEHYPDDNPIEEWVETKIGVDDLTPWSKE